MRQETVRLFSMLWTACGLAAASLRAHKLRSFLTLLGVIVGVSSVVIVGAAIEGLGSYAEVTTSQAFGSNTFLVARIAAVGNLSRVERARKLRYNRRISLDDVWYLQQVTGDRVIYSPYRQRADDIRRGNQLFEGANLLGVGAALIQMREIPIADGRFFTEQEERNRQFVAVIGDEIARELFPDTSPVGRTVRVRGYDFLVVGVIDRLGSPGGQNQDNAVYVPSAAFTRLYGESRDVALFGAPRPGSGMTLDEALDVARSALRVRFHARPGRPDNFDVLTPDSIRDFVDNILGIIGAVVVPITSISLVVGGIVIMNIMLVTVTERTREIGLRKSVGARQMDIRLQFLMEAVFTALAGGLIGVLAGAAVAAVLSAVFDLTLRVTLPYIALAIVVSTTVGVLSGWYPASRAARMDPVAALRAE